MEGNYHFHIELLLGYCWYDKVINVREASFLMVLKVFSYKNGFDEILFCVSLIAIARSLYLYLIIMCYLFVV